MVAANYSGLYGLLALLTLSVSPVVTLTFISSVKSEEDFTAVIERERLLSGVIQLEILYVVMYNVLKIAALT